MLDKAQFKKEAFSLARDVIIAMVIVGIILGSVVLYTGNWPPLVVVESGSMRHSQDSAIGPIDAGDLVLVKVVNSRQDVITYLEGIERQHVQILDGQGVLEYQFNHTGTRSPYSTYGEAGDVIVYYKNGDRADTPIIHRAILWLDYNNTGSGSFNVPELGLNGFSGKIRLLEMGHLKQTMVIDLGDVLSKGFNATGRPHGGFITLGDANRGSYDQRSHRDARGNPIEPIEVAWIYGEARGEIPWFGAIKLHFSNDPVRGEIPGNVWTNIILTIVALIGAAISLDILTYYLNVRKERKNGRVEKDGRGDESEVGAEEERALVDGDDEQRRGEEGIDKEGAGDMGENGWQHGATEDERSAERLE